MSAFQITKVRKGIFHIELRKKDCDPDINVSDSIALILKFEGVIVELYAVLQKELLQITSCKKKSVATLNIHLFLDSRGAYAISLRVLACTSITSLDNSNVTSKLVYQELSSISHDTIIRLSERSLGGSGNGITNAQIDSQYAVANLLSLPLKSAFKVR